MKRFVEILTIKNSRNWEKNNFHVIIFKNIQIILWIFFVELKMQLT